jgi:hypothetical protein
MNRLRTPVVLAALLVLGVCAYADNKPEKITEIGRQQLIRSLNAEPVFVKKIFPMGQKGLRIEDGKITPNDAEVQQMIADFGPAAKPGDRVRITNLYFKKYAIIFEINGGPVKKKKWYQRIEVSGAGGGTAPLDPGDDRTNARGSFLMLAFKDYIPQVSPDQVRHMLEPVFDFNASSVAEAYIKTLPPKLQAAIKNKEVLVGMDHEMVMYAKGRPDKKHREGEGEDAYEEWIYGAPPQKVEFVRFKGDQVVRLEIMAVDGQKIVRTEPEIEIKKNTEEVAQKKQEEEEKPTNAPSLMRPGEKPVNPTVANTVQVQTDKKGNPTDPKPQQVPDTGTGTAPLPN